MTKNRQIRLFTAGSLAIFFILAFAFVFKTEAVVRFPIKELGDCRNDKECYFYCEIPRNFPACWSYGKYIKPQVLGEITVNITYPVAELDNCIDAKTCFEYCGKEKNRDNCINFAKNKGLLKQDKLTKISAFIQKTAEKELGCDSKESCLSVCELEENKDKCRDFAIKNKILKIKIEQKTKEVKKEVMEKAREELGCLTAEECKNACSLEDNHDKCRIFARKYFKDNTAISSDSSTTDGSAPASSILPKTTPISTVSIDPPESLWPCQKGKECDEYCKAHPDECPGFPKKTNTSKSFSEID